MPALTLVLGCRTAQPPAAPVTLALDSAQGELGEFTAISSVRELADGRVLISDPREGAVFIGDFASGEVGHIGRVGGGPQEYRFAAPLLPIAGDSSFQYDAVGRSYLIYHADSIVVTSFPGDPLTTAAMLVRSADEQGSLLYIGRGATSRAPMPGAPEDSIPILLYRRGTAVTDTLGRLRGQILPPGKMRPAYSYFEQAFLAPDG